MQLGHADVAIVTGASRGLGVYIARALAAKGVRLVLAARSGESLSRVADELRGGGAEVLAVPTDVVDPKALEKLVGEALARFGRIDVLVNNAGADYALPFDQRSVDDIRSMVELNLTSPMILTRLVLPGMLERRRGHVVNIASLAGVLPSPYEELYVATKHGLVGFTRSLRASAQDMGWPVSASVVCPGFMDGAGIYESMKSEYGVAAPPAMGSLSADKLGEAVIRCIERDEPDVMLTKGTPRLGAVMQALAPRLFERVSAKLGVASVFRSVAQRHVAERSLSAG